MPKSFGWATIACHNIKHVLWHAIATCVALYSQPGLKLDSTFPSIQFLTNGFSVPHRLDQNSKGGGILLYVRDKIIVLPLNRYSLPPHIEILFCELNLRNRKWLVCCSYNPHKKNLGQKRTSQQSSWYWRVRWRWWSNKQHRGQ